MLIAGSVPTKQVLSLSIPFTFKLGTENTNKFNIYWYAHNKDADSFYQTNLNLAEIEINGEKNKNGNSKIGLIKNLSNNNSASYWSGGLLKNNNYEHFDQFNLGWPTATISGEYITPNNRFLKFGENISISEKYIEAIELENNSNIIGKWFDNENKRK